MLFPFDRIIRAFKIFLNEFTQMEQNKNPIDYIDIVNALEGKMIMFEVLK